MAKNRYYLFGRDRDDNKVKAISLSEYDIYGSGNDIKVLDNSLEAIDYMTLRYRNQEELIDYLVSTGRIDNYNTELFIVSRNSKNINYLENIYSNSVFFRDLKKVTLWKLKHFPVGFANDEILDRFSSMMINDEEFRRFIFSKYHKVYTRYIEQFVDCDNIDTAKNIKYRNTGWARESYPLLRNIVEAINRYNYFKDKGDLITSALYYEVDSNSVRNMSVGDISIYTDKGYGEGQLNLFIENSEPDKIMIVSDSISRLDSDSFLIDEDNKIIFNRNKFKCSDVDYRRLNGLDQKLLRLIYMYLTTKRFCDEDGCKESTNNDTSDNIFGNINKLLSEDENILNRAYAFCLLYNRINDNKKNIKRYAKKKDD